MYSTPVDYSTPMWIWAAQTELSGLLKIKKDMKLGEVDPGGIQGKRKGIM